MGVSNTKPIAPARRRTKRVSFTGLLRSKEGEGQGACFAQNVILDNDGLTKMKGPSLLLERANVGEIVWIGRSVDANKEALLLYAVKSSLSGKYILETYNIGSAYTGYPLLQESSEKALTGTMTFTNGSTAVSASGGAFTTEISVGDTIYLDGEYSDGVRVESITDDDNLVLVEEYGGTGGAGNGKSATQHFSSNEFFSRVIGTYTYIANKATTNNLFTFDGATLIPVVNCPDNPRYMLIDGNAIVINETRSGEVTVSMNVASPDFTAGTGVQESVSYSTGMEANGGTETSSGIILMGGLGGQLHKAIPNAASDEVSAETKLNSFVFTGLGVQNTYQIVSGKNFGYNVNENGIHEFNLFSGESRNLVEDGNIARRWKTFDVTEAVIGYDAKNNKIVVLVKSVGQYDTMIVVDLEDQNRAISIQPNSYFQTLVTIDNQLYGGSSIDGKIYKLFDTISDRDDNAVRTRWIMEWDELEGIATENVIKQILIYANLNPLSTMKVNLYRNGSHEPAKSETFSGAPAQQQTAGSTIGVSGLYVYALGGGRDANLSVESDIIRKFKKSTRVVTYAIEIIEESVHEFSIYDIIVEYKTRPRLSREKTQPNFLFT